METAAQFVVAAFQVAEVDHQLARQAQSAEVVGTGRERLDGGPRRAAECGVEVWLLQVGKRCGQNSRIPMKPRRMKKPPWRGAARQRTRCHSHTISWHSGSRT